MIIYIKLKLYERVHFNANLIKFESLAILIGNRVFSKKIFKESVSNSSDHRLDLKISRWLA